MVDAYREKFAEYYDLIYRDKDYVVECSFVETAFHNYSSVPIKTILDLGCGTAGHAIPLAKKGYTVVGIDGSPAMLALARTKACQSQVNLRLHHVTMQQLGLGETFDACICMFNVLGYVTEDKDIQLVLQNVRRHLKRDSLFIFDCWNGLGVLRILPSIRVKTVEDQERRVIRIAEPELDACNHLCHVHYHLLILRSGVLHDEFEETHTIRYFFPREATHYLHESDFEVLKICPSLDLGGKADENCWNISIIAKAV